MRALVAVLVASLAFAGPVHATERIVVAFGDSLTAGLGVMPDESYPAQLQARLRADGYAYRVVNAGASGDTTAGGLRRVDWALKNKPDVVIVALGANDGLRGLPTIAMRDNLRAIVRRAQSAGAKVLLAGMRLPPNYGVDYAQEFEKVFSDLARGTKAPLIPFLLEGVAGEARLNLADGIHPNAEGQRRVAEHVWPHLRQLLAKAGVSRGALQ